MSDKTILIVDDSLISRMFMRKAVQGTFSHWNVLEASNGHDALSAVEGKQVDIALLDLNMPGGINGLALAKSLKDVYANIQIALVTANIQSAVREKASALGVEFIAKPITEDKIVDFLKTCAE
ncbi:MAG: response regulator [Deltaproteobacteria bacterium]|nr:response regulator [Deltaproteobacteria bacterium]MBT6432510.1 response regulator [Deltaproteobacteria bacterium]MBT6491665.1 response regulator [Deltaproteobacteria bacterium]